MLRTEIPKISAACHQVILFAIARKITSCTFIARSQASSGYRFILPPSGRRLYPKARLQRTDHVLIEADISCANDNTSIIGVKAK